MKPRIVFVHGNDTLHWASPWVAWLKAELDKLGFETFFETMPDSILARRQYWLPFLQDIARVGERDVIVGWSSGAVAAMRYAEQHKIGGSILIGACYTDLDDEMEKQSGYFDDPWQWEAIKANQEKVAVVYGDDDPYIDQAEFAHIAEQLGATKLSIPGGKHFIERTEFPVLLEYINKTYGS